MLPNNERFVFHFWCIIHLTVAYLVQFNLSVSVYTVHTRVLFSVILIKWCCHHQCTFAHGCLGKVNCCFWWGISFKKNILHFNDGLEVKQLQPLTAKCHKLPLFCFDDFSPSSKSMEFYKKNLKVVRRTETWKDLLL